MFSAHPKITSEFHPYSPWVLNCILNSLKLLTKNIKMSFYPHFQNKFLILSSTHIQFFFTLYPFFFPLFYTVFFCYKLSWPLCHSLLSKMILNNNTTTSNGTRTAVIEWRKQRHNQQRLPLLLNRHLLALLPLEYTWILNENQW